MALRLVFFLVFAIAGLFATNGWAAEGDVVTNAGYRTNIRIYNPVGKAKPVTLIYLHDKWGGPRAKRDKAFIGRLRRAGYRVLAPLMPWAARRGYEGTRSQGLSVVDAAVEQGGDRVVVIGHGMGAIAVLQYGAKGAARGVVGLVAIAPSHDPHMSAALSELSGKAAAEACGLVDNGDWAQRRSYPELAGAKSVGINSTAEYYCSYYSTRHFPDSRKMVTYIAQPLLLISGNKDQATRVYQHKALFEKVPKRAKDKYLVLPGSHLGVLWSGTKPLIAWVDQL